MEKLPMCRVCLAENVRMYIVVNKNLRELYEKLTENPFVTEDNRPILACFFCCTKLKQCYQFQRKCLEAEELFAQMMSEDYELNPLIYQDHLVFCNGFIQTPTELITIAGAGQTQIVAIKEELPAVCERLDGIIEPKEEYESDELVFENKENKFSAAEDVPAQHSESDSEADVSLLEYKIDVEEHEVSRDNRRASDTQLEPVAKKPKLQVRGRKPDVTEEQKKNDLSHTKAIRNSQNFTTKPITDIKRQVNNLSLGTNSRENRNKAKKKCEKYTKIDDTDINKHRRQRVKGKTFRCDICQRSFNHKANLGTHKRVHIVKKSYKCDVCQKCFSNQSSFTIHIRTHTGEKPYTCDICQRSFICKTNLKNHNRVHTGEKPYQCDICQNCFTDKSSLKQHIRIHTGEKPYKCGICPRSFACAGNLKSHNRVHTREKPYQCDVCQNCFTEKASLKKHIRIHTGEKPYKCDICQRSFNDKGSLIVHNRGHTGQKPFKCDVCQRGFKEKCKLIHHIRTHTGEKPYKCDVCQHCSGTKMDLIRHIRTHTDVKPYKCGKCQRCFRRKYHLTMHSRTHTGEKPYTCDVCQRCFSAKGNLKTHFRIHTGEKRYK